MGMGAVVGDHSISFYVTTIWSFMGSLDSYTAEVEPMKKTLYFVFEMDLFNLNGQ